jgi:hypothetical protein
MSFLNRPTTAYKTAAVLRHGSLKEHSNSSHSSGMFLMNRHLEQPQYSYVNFTKGAIAAPAVLWPSPTAAAAAAVAVYCLEIRISPSDAAQSIREMQALTEFSKLSLSISFTTVRISVELTNFRGFPRTCWYTLNRPQPHPPNSFYSNSRLYFRLIRCKQNLHLEQRH